MGLAFSEQIEAPRVLLSELTAANSWPEGQIVYVTDLDAIYVSTGAAWVAAVSSPATLVDAKGDLLAGTGNDALSRLAVGSDGQELFASSVTGPHGLKWRDPSVGIDAVARYNMDPTGVTSVSANLQAAIDYAQTQVPGGGSSSDAPPIIMRAGQYSMTTAINWKSASFIGQPGLTRLWWDGAAGATVFTKDETQPGGLSFGGMEGFRLTARANEPATWFDFESATHVLDIGMRLRELTIQGCTSDAIKLSQWINLHWEHMRFDLVGGYAIRATPPVGQSLSSLNLDNFTYDHQRSSGPGTGVLMIDNSAQCPDVGVIRLANGRIEVNNAWAAPKSVVAIKQGATAFPVSVVLENVTYQDVVGMADDVLVYRDTANTTSSENLLLLNVSTGGMSAFAGGTWATFQQFPTGTKWQRASIGTTLDELALSIKLLPRQNVVGLTVRAHPSTPTVNLVEFRNAGDALRWSVSNGGHLQGNASNLILDTTTGTMIGTAANQKVSAYGATPIVQPSGTAANATDLASALTLVNDLKAKLIALGWIA